MWKSNKFTSLIHNIDLYILQQMDKYDAEQFHDSWFTSFSY